MIPLRIFFLFCLLIGQLMFAQSPERSNAWTVDDIILQERVGGAILTPKGDAVIWTKRRPAKKKDAFVSDIYLTRMTEEQKDPIHRLTQGDNSESSVVCSADGHTLYFLSSRKGGKHIWKLSRFGGEAEALDSLPIRPSQLTRWNDSTLVFLAGEKPSWQSQALKKKKDNVVVVEDTAHFNTRRLFAYDLKSKQIRRLTDNKFPISSFDIDEDGKWLVTRHTMSPHYPSDGKPSPKIYVWDLTDGSKTEILATGFQTPGSFQFTEDHAGCYFTAVQSSDPEWEGSGIDWVYYYDLTTQKPIKVELNWAWGADGGIRVWGNDVIAFLANGTTAKWQYYQKNGNTWNAKPINAGAWTNHLGWLGGDAKQNRIFVSYSTASKVPTYWGASLEVKANEVILKQKKEFARLNPALHKKETAKTEVIKWTGALNDTVDGILYYPKDYQAGKAYPLMVAIHGGPSGTDMDRWSDRWAYYHQLLTQRGCFVLKPNYHGSSFHGQKFVESIKGHYYEYEVPDIIAGIDYLADKGMVDKSEMGLLGWSNGAILAIQLTVQYPDLFKAAAPGAGDVNWTSDFGTCRFGVTFDQSYFGGAPWDDKNGKSYNEAYILKSPLFELEKVKTPTLICHGSEDRAVPRDQGWEYYRALQQNGKAPVRFLWFPGQPHGLQKITHQRRKVEEELRWFDTYLFDTYEAPNEALKKSSPLMAFMDKAALAQDGGLYGERVQKTLIPQTMVAFTDSIAVGVFEVTHAQYQAFAKDHTYSVQEANQPIVGLSGKQIKSYLSWLKQQTGNTYRLPTEDEAKALQRLAKKAAKSENTLAYWAGYQPNPQDADMIKRFVDTLDHPLFLQVGTFSPTKVGAAKIYDLGGNVAEYYQAAEGLKTYGYHAYEVVDPMGEYVEMPPNRTGIRVVKELK